MQYSRSLIYAAAALSFVAELLYLWELPTAYELWWIYGTFLLIAAIAQGAGAVILLFWPRLRWIALGLLGNILLLAAYVLIRVIGDRITLSLPPLASEELNLAIAYIEIVLIILLSLLLGQGLRSSYPAQQSTRSKLWLGAFRDSTQR
jgi:hypothetical protein